VHKAFDRLRVEKDNAQCPVRNAQYLLFVGAVVGINVGAADA